MFRRLLVGFALFITVFLAMEGSEKDPVYDLEKDVSAVMVEAFEKASREGKRVMVLYGADWCPDCLVLDRMMNEGVVKELVERRFVVVKVAIGRWDTNLVYAEAMGIEVKNGIPAMAVLDGPGNVVFATLAGELATARSMGKAELHAFLDKIPES